ncbi:hypothetical protein BD311DRAFT_778988 [Dichomitus squalens]|uniref:Uncharacterized protein n=1 Tax=Dichomitus squalens TaxID=114155 RepID=A0A4Q9MK68_9APHY|nr:hypothetical protein BD311DRAFT_778988 [Dichomitus squalens]
MRRTVCLQEEKVSHLRTQRDLTHDTVLGLDHFAGSSCSESNVCTPLLYPPKDTVGTGGSLGLDWAYCASQLYSRFESLWDNVGSVLAVAVLSHAEGICGPL